MPVSSRREFLKQIGAAVVAAAWMPRALADDLIRLHRAELVKRQESYQLIGGFNIRLNSALEEALQRGVTLTFLQQFEADRPRDFWFAEDVAVLNRHIKLSYHALLRYYQLSVEGAPPSTHEQLGEALGALGGFHDWRVIEAKALDRKQLYRARVRMSLDTSQLPKPLQVNAVVSSRWELDSGWQEWPFKP
jgi:hypothetical protein